MAVLEGDDRTCFGPYRLVRRIGTGGMGSVFEAEDTGLGHGVALKLLHPHVAERPGAARRFLREGRAAARIRHPHVVQVLALGTEGETPYLAMELLDQGNLSQLIALKGALSVCATLDLVLPVIAAVAAAHDAGVIHRDLKPSNVCFASGPAGRPWSKVVDFGVSKIVSAGGNEGTVTDTVIGTAAYMAPEQARAACNASFRSDEYSLAVMLYQCMTGELPFGGRSLYEVLESVMSAPVAPPSARAKNIPQALDEALLRGMSRNPDDRFPSVRAFGAALLQFASEHTQAAHCAELRQREVGDSYVAVMGGTTSFPLAPDIATPLGDSTAPPTASTAKRKPHSVSRRTSWLALAVLMGASLAAANGVRTHRPGAVPRSAEQLPVASQASGLPVAPPPSADLGEQNPTEPIVMGNAPVSNASSIPAAGAVPLKRSIPTLPRMEHPRPPAAIISFGENGAPILP